MARALLVLASAPRRRSPKRLSPWTRPEVPCGEPSSATRWKFRFVTLAQVCRARAHSRCHVAVGAMEFSVAKSELVALYPQVAPSGAKLKAIFGFAQDVPITA